MAVRSFSAQLRAQTRLTQRRLDAVFKQSAQQVINKAQVPTAKGGQMRVKTGFLRNSGRVGIGQMPTGPARNEKGEIFDWSTDPQGQAAMVAKINEASPGTAIFFGWAANYARARNAKDGFLDLAVQDWKKIVETHAKRARLQIR